VGCALMCCMRGCFLAFIWTVEGSRVYLISVNDDLKVQTYSVVSSVRDQRVDASCYRCACSSRLMSLPWVWTVQRFQTAIVKAVVFLRCMFCIADVTAVSLVSMFLIVLRVASHR